ncbi:DUF3987 domain-containing protein [Cyanobium sp. BA5m-21]|nr:DUF3987 domain-containing protein [Cyanobium sp. BA5m-10]MCP9906545.1 DUF3987 domain-containing protein [Cyanobium sp. BA5m-21]
MQSNSRSLDHHAQAAAEPERTLPNHPAEQFLQLLGKDPGQTYFRTVRHGKGANRSRRGKDLHGFDLQALARDNQAGESIYFVTGNSTTASGKAGGVENEDVTSCPALFAEWDDRPIEWQLQAWLELGLPEPTIQLLTGNKSVHCYWLLTEAMEKAQWRPLQAQLIDHCGSDQKCKNEARLMRLPGFAYIDKKTGQPNGKVAEVVHTSATRYSPEQIEACLPSLLTPPPAAPAKPPARGLPHRTLQEIEAAAACIPERVVGGNTYEPSRRALCGCAAALAEIGLPEEQALDLLASKWPDRATAKQVLHSSSTREAASFWAIAGEHGFSLARSATNNKVVPLKSKRKQHQAPEPKHSRLLTMAEVAERLREAISEGMGGADLAALVAELAAAAEQASFDVQRMAEAIRAEQLQVVAVAVEAQQIAAEHDRQEIGELLSAGYLLPPSIAAAIETRSRYLPCCGPSAVLPFLATVAGLVKLGTEVEGCAVAGYRVPINLFACLVGRSGAKKSPIGRLLVEAPTAGLRAELAHANQRERAAWEQECREMKKGEAKPAAPTPKRLSVSDFTGEALAAQLQTQEAAGLGLLVNRDELSGLFGSLNAYRGGRGADEQQLLELFDGSGLSSLRIVGDRHYSRSQLSIWGSTQPDVLRQLVADGDASGLWARFLFVPLPERAIPLPMSTSAAEVGEVEAAAQTLADACSAVYRLPRHTYRLAPAAAESFAHYELNRQRAALGATIGAQSALYGKSAGKVLRVAGVLHLLRIAAGEANSGALIEQATIEQAAALVDHLDAWALGLHAEVAAGGVGQLMRTVHRVAEAVAAPIRWKELAVRLSAKARKETDAAAFAEAARALAAAGYGEVEVGKRQAVSYRATCALP